MIQEQTIQFRDKRKDNHMPTLNTLTQNIEIFTEITLTDGSAIFTLFEITPDLAHGEDSLGCGYTRCDLGSSCEHPHAPANATVWHDNAHTEELWEVKA